MSPAAPLVQSPNATLRSQAVFELKPHKSLEIPVFIDVPRDSFQAGKRHVHIRIDDSSGFERVVTLTLLGPEGPNESAPLHDRPEGGAR